MGSMRDIVAAILRAQIPVLMAVNGAQVRIITSAPRVEPRTYGAWTGVVAQFEEKHQTFVMDQATNQLVIRRIGHLTISDAFVFPDGSQYSVSGAQPFWTVSTAYGPHQVRAGLITYQCVRDEPLSAGADRGAHR